MTFLSLSRSFECWRVRIGVENVAIRAELLLSRERVEKSEFSSWIFPTLPFLVSLSLRCWKFHFSSALVGIFLITFFRLSTRSHFNFQFLLISRSLAHTLLAHTCDFSAQTELLKLWIGQISCWLWKDMCWQDVRDVCDFFNTLFPLFSSARGEISIFHWILKSQLICAIKGPQCKYLISHTSEWDEKRWWNTQSAAIVPINLPDWSLSSLLNINVRRVCLWHDWDSTEVSQMWSIFITIHCTYYVMIINSISPDPPSLYIYSNSHNICCFDDGF